jgi:hypothetical protein
MIEEQVGLSLSGTLLCTTSAKAGQRWRILLS